MVWTLKENKHPKHKIKKAIQMQNQLSHFSLSCKSQQHLFLPEWWGDALHSPLAVLQQLIQNSTSAPKLITSSWNANNITWQYGNEGNQKWNCMSLWVMWTSGYTSDRKQKEECKDVWEHVMRKVSIWKVPHRHPLRKTWHPGDAHVTADELCFSGKVK